MLWTTSHASSARGHGESHLREYHVKRNRVVADDVKEPGKNRLHDTETARVDKEKMAEGDDSIEDKKIEIPPAHVLSFRKSVS